MHFYLTSFFKTKQELIKEVTKSLSRVVIEYHSWLFLGPILEIGSRNLTSFNRLLSLGGKSGLDIRLVGGPSSLTCS